MPAFKIAEVRNSVGLYRAVMGKYPDLRQCFSSELKRAFRDQDVQNKYREWDANPDLPLVCTTSAEDDAFAVQLSQITGRRFSIASDIQNEYAIRGRERNGEGQALGNITNTKFYFGNADDEVKAKAFIFSNLLTQGHAHLVHEVPHGANPDEYKNSYGLIHAVGNVFVRSSDGVLRGAAFNTLEERDARSSESTDGYARRRSDNIGSVLVESL